MQHCHNVTMIHCATISANLMSTKIPNGNMEHCNNNSLYYNKCNFNIIYNYQVVTCNIATTTHHAHNRCNNINVL